MTSHSVKQKLSKDFSLADFARAYPPEKQAYDAQYLWMAPMARWAFYPSRMLIRLGLSANQVTYLSWACILGGTLLLATGRPLMVAVGVLLLNLWMMLDCADGVMARHYARPSHYGAFIDTLGYHLAGVGLWVGAGVGQGLQPDPWAVRFGLVESKWVLVALGLITALFGVVGDLMGYVFEQQFSGLQDGGQNAAVSLPYTFWTPSYSNAWSLTGIGIPSFKK